MITKSLFNEIQDKAKQYKYTSIKYLDYDECNNSDVLLYSLNIILLLDKSKLPAKVYFATDTFEMVLDYLNQFDSEIQINFVPHEFKEKLEDIGFCSWAEYIDFFNYSLVDTIIEHRSFNDIMFLHQNECALASVLSKRCANQSRGFIGETEEWFSDWASKNDVIIVRQNDEIAGFCCVSIYNNGTTLWLREIAVDPNYQGAGLGKKLMEQAICYGINKGAIKGFLAADVLNDTAIKLYNKYGFNTKDTFGELQMRRTIY